MNETLLDISRQFWEAMEHADEVVILCQEKVQIKNDFFPSCQHT